RGAHACSANGEPRVSRESALTGNLRREPLARLLHRLYVERLTGILIVGEGTQERRVYLQAGQPVAAISASAVENAARVLLERGMAPQDLCAHSFCRTQERGEQQPPVLEKWGAATDHEVGRPRPRQSLETLLRLFRIRSASFSIQIGDHEYARAHGDHDPS